LLIKKGISCSLNQRDGKPVVYVNGFSTSLPADIQYKAMQSVAGFEK
jgi:tRNA U34 5-carboxymethylaminomethyl modifying enzyme MnmG/GidA